MKQNIFTISNTNEMHKLYAGNDKFFYYFSLTTKGW